MESMRDVRRIMEKEAAKGSTPLKFDHISLDEECYQKIIADEKMTEVLQYLHRIGKYKQLAGKTVINNVYTYMRGNAPDFSRARSIIDRDRFYHQMLRRTKKIQSGSNGDCYIETAKCYFSLPPAEWEKHTMKYDQADAYGFIMSNKYILNLYKYCRNARRDFAWQMRTKKISDTEERLMALKDVKVMSHCLLLDDVWQEDNLIGANMYTIYMLE